MEEDLSRTLDLEWMRKEAKRLLRAYRGGEDDAVARAEEQLGDRARCRFGLSDAQWVLARERGFHSWAELARWVAAGEREPLLGHLGFQPTLAAYEGRARTLVAAARAGEPAAVRLVRGHVPRLADFSGGALSVPDAKLVLARERGWATWSDLARVVRSIKPHEGMREGSAEVMAALELIRRCDVDGLEELLDARPELTGDVHNGAWSTLLEAIALPNVVGDDLGVELGVDRRIVELLIERGSELAMPLRLGAMGNRAELVRLLVDAGADPDGEPWFESTPLEDAVCFGAKETVDVLAGRAEIRALWVAAGVGGAEAVDRWFDAAGALRPEAFALRPRRMDVGWPPGTPPPPPPQDDPQEVLGEALALAAANGRVEAMERLLERGASVDGAVDDVSALHLAVTHARVDAARWLLERGADVTVRDRTRRWTPVAWSALWARRGGADRVAVRDLLVAATAGAARGNLPLAFEREWARWSARGSAVLESALRYGGERPVLVLVSRRPCRYSFSDRGGAVDAAGRPPGWHEAARAVEKEHGVNVSRNGVVFLPAVERRELTWLESLPDRIAQASVALYGALLELDG